MTWASAIKAAIGMSIIAALLFIPAGTLDWRGAWILLAEFACCGLVLVLWLKRHDPNLLSKRMGGMFQKGQVTRDKVIMSFFAIVYFGWLALMGLDVKRWGISHMSEWPMVAGVVLIPLGFLAVGWTFRVNSFAAPVVAIQENQTVIDTGPYRFMRHPMYAGALVYMIGMPLVLGSWLGLAALPLIVFLLAIRILVEEHVLKKNLPGYDEYAARVRWRLLPGVW